MKGIPSDEKFSVLFLYFSTSFDRINFRKIEPKRENSFTKTWCFKRDNYDQNNSSKTLSSVDLIMAYNFIVFSRLLPIELLKDIELINTIGK